MTKLWTMTVTVTLNDTPETHGQAAALLRTFEQQAQEVNGFRDFRWVTDDADADALDAVKAREEMEARNEDAPIEFLTERGRASLDEIMDRDESQSIDTKTMEEWLHG